MAEQASDVRRTDAGAEGTRSDSSELDRRRPLPRIKPGWTIKGL